MIYISQVLHGTFLDLVGYYFLTEIEHVEQRSVKPSEEVEHIIFLSYVLYS